MLVYSGDDDAVCATRGTQRWLWEDPLTPSWKPQVTKPWGPWTMDDGPGCPGGPACTQVAGFSVHFKGLSFVSVHGAGHLVPATRPAQGLKVLENFLEGVW